MGGGGGRGNEAKRRTEKGEGRREEEGPSAGKVELELNAERRAY